MFITSEKKVHLDFFIPAKSVIFTYQLKTHIMAYPTPSPTNPYKLVYNSGTGKIGFVPQTAADKRATQELSDRLNAIITNTSSPSAIQAKTDSDALKAAINARIAQRDC